METNDLVSLTQAKNALRKEYVCIKKQMQLEKADERNASAIDDPIYDLVDKQYLLIQELFSKYTELQSQFSYRKMFIEHKAEVFEEVHSTVLNRLLERNYKQETMLKQLSDELEALKKANKRFDFSKRTEAKHSVSCNRDCNSQNSFISNALTSNKDQDSTFIQVSKKKTINVYNYNSKTSIQKTCSSSLNTTTTSNSKFNIGKTNNNKVRINETSHKPITSSRFNIYK